ncbi:piggyBac transposable element-derived protein 3-like [Penaeus monodon]|uniref:piggyBac transposable element-derived protein 3-like n=1 Tax=Penaeus monodon TaxID=6687 RepID=UPI0018A70EE9|nr:piggyBac transposable element-derived protein 3-like [Penaeus monodon]
MEKGFLDDRGQLHTPLEYFRRFIINEMIESIVTYANQYIVQKTGTCINTTVKESEQVIRLVLRMGIIEMPGIRVYSEDNTRYGPVADIIGRKIGQHILRCLHFVDNEAIFDEGKTDKLWKIRPSEIFCEPCPLAISGEKQSIDEMMIPFKGLFSQIKQCLRGKPNPWGFKGWCCCSTDGMLHDFEVYQMKAGTKGKKSSLGVAREVFRKLSATLPQQKN